MAEERREGEYVGSDEDQEGAWEGGRKRTEKRGRKTRREFFAKTLPAFAQDTTHTIACRFNRGLY